LGPSIIGDKFLSKISHVGVFFGIIFMVLIVLEIVFVVLNRYKPSLNTKILGNHDLFTYNSSQELFNDDLNQT